MMKDEMLKRAWVACGHVRDLINRPNTFNDPYVEWLLLVNAGMQSLGNAYLFDLAIKAAPAAAMLEIGSFCGLSTNIIQYLKKTHGRSEPLFTCDKWAFEGQAPLPAAAPVSHAEIRDYVRESFARSVHRFSGDDLPFTIEATSDEFFEGWRERAEVKDVFGRTVELGGPLGFCFIDGDHSEEFVQRDFENCDKYLVQGGLILFDDSKPQSIGDAWNVVKRIKQGGRYEVVGESPNYLFRKK